MKLKERLIRDINVTLDELSVRAKRLPDMDDHSIRSFANLLGQVSKEAAMLSGILDYECELKR